MEDREKAFKQLINENHDKIYRICSYHSGSRDDCNDLYQQVLINIWQALRTFRGDSKISTWIYRIALNTAIDHTRAESRNLQKRRKFELENTNLLGQSDERWQKIREEKMLETLNSEIIQLSIIDKLIMSLVMEDVASKEIADIVGISEGNVRVKIHRIKENLKLTIGGQHNA